MSRRHPRSSRPCHTPAKQLYVSRAAAETAADFARRVYEPAMTAYRCPCGWWHLTSHPRQEQPA